MTPFVPLRWSRYWYLGKHGPDKKFPTSVIATKSKTSLRFVAPGVVFVASGVICGFGPEEHLSGTGNYFIFVFKVLIQPDV